MAVGDLTITIGKNQITLSDIKRHASEATLNELQDLLKLYPHLTIENLVMQLTKFNKEVNLELWKKDLKRKHDSLSLSSIKDGDYLVSNWDRILNEFYDYSTMKELNHLFNDSDVPHKAFSLVKMYEVLQEKDNEKYELAIRLIDVKLNYMFLYSLQNSEYEGAYQIVGNNDLEKLSPLTLIGLKGISKKVYYLSVIIEKTLDLADFIKNGKSKDHKKGKWDKKLDDLTEFLDIQDDEKIMLSDFKNLYRTSELHKLSSVRSMTTKNQWDHLQKEEELVKDILKRLFSKITSSTV